ncbi:hypothetical protein MP638_002224 [Amoeboaphelidium occidentale]|nr:hypothetical protein MP638_002224 [Amoeboaphelidium occidentale]
MQQPPQRPPNGYGPPPVNQPGPQGMNNRPPMPMNPQNQRPPGQFPPGQQGMFRPPMPQQPQQQPQFRPMPSMPPNGQPVQPPPGQPQMGQPQFGMRPPMPQQQQIPPPGPPGTAQQINDAADQLARMQMSNAVVSPPSHRQRKAYPSQALSQQQSQFSPQFVPTSQQSTPYQQQPQQQPVPPPQQQQGYNQFQQPPGPPGSQYPQQPPQPHPQSSGAGAPQSFFGAYYNQPQQQQPLGGGPPKPKINPDQIPSPVVGQLAEQEMWQNVEYNTVSDVVPPAASTDFVAIDNGNANPRFIRSTCYSVATTNDIAQASQIPIGLVIQPLAEIKPQERQIQLVDHGETGPIRCNRCKAYMNPNMIWLNGGSKFMCNICEFTNETPENYFAPLDQNGYRVDWHQRPELQAGVVEYKATKEFSTKPPVPANFVFVVDVSYPSVQAGVLGSFIEALEEILEYFPMDEESEESPCSIGLITFDRVLHFYDLNPSLSQAHVHVVSDVDDVFVPIQTGFLVNPHKSGEIIKLLLKQLHGLHSNPRPGVENCFGAAMKAAQVALQKTGGRIICLNHSLPTVGPGALKAREEAKLMNTENERQLYVPQDNYYMKLADECVNVGAAVDMFLFPSAYIDVATIGVLSGLTGGRCRVYHRFHQEKDGLSFTQDFQRAITRPFGYDAWLRVRCGNGLRVHEHYGNFSMRNSTDIEMPLVDSETAFAVQFKHDGNLGDNKRAQFQVAMLYTTPLGDRRIRVINLTLRCTNEVGQIFKWADCDVTLNLLSKAAVSQTTSLTLKNIRDSITEKCILVLSAYRKICASASPPGQLILPDSFKFYPVYALSILKSKAFKAAVDISSDTRVEEMRAIRNMNVSTSISFFYPRLYSLHDLDEKACEYDTTSKFVFPTRLRTSWEKFSMDGIYLLENTKSVIIWIGIQAEPKLLTQLFGVDSIQAVNPRMKVLPKLDNPFSKKIRELLYYIQEQERKGVYPPLEIIRQGEPTEMYMKQSLVEDEGYESMNYVDYLCFVHKQIQTALSD